MSTLYYVLLVQPMCDAFTTSKKSLVIERYLVRSV